jgi:hypothetical protein
MENKITPTRVVLVAMRNFDTHPMKMAMKSIVKLLFFLGRVRRGSRIEGGLGQGGFATLNVI